MFDVLYRANDSPLANSVFTKVTDLSTLDLRFPQPLIPSTVESRYPGTDPTLESRILNLEPSLESRLSSLEPGTLESLES